ncbi:hypothetical protein WL21_26515 [Burkholderia ubonensis]|uniref:hypothetical protein n=1 Tax=Burkholderia ubonensis TaxID=101571 RepID=UPI00075CCA7C|nr:hypothetical protein [Burkholderia ubonensis]KVO91158.1 hypothetical protein WJ81_11295 [Burkholderia ubonensis]KVZ59652.1 hypothetical protein WL20_19845 [Burkholderia ubonensis]KVZ61606.1 hypothetical protein WL21_26515 [Burkholderia ubonensis]
MAKTVEEKIVFLAARISEDTKKLEELKASVAAQRALTSLKQGDVIRFNYGRGETRGEFMGEVRAVFDTDKGKGKGIKVIKGSGADEEIVTIRPGDIVGIGEEVRETVAQDAEATQGSGGLAPADPLAGIE